MRALVKYAPGEGNVAVREVPVPEPAPDELLIRVKYCGICGTDLHIYADEFPNDPPVIMGHEYCGTVVEVGTEAGERWAVGERVVGELHTGACGTCALCQAGKPHICNHKLALGSRHDGAFAEYLALPAWLAHKVPDGVPWEVAGVTEPFAISAHCLVERGRLGPQRSLLISGAATMGLMATIWASRLGVEQIIVSGTEIDEPVRFPLARAMGATEVVNVQREDLRNVVLRCTGGEGVDAWIECSGSARAITGGLELVRKTGQVVLIGLVGPETIAVPWNTLLYKELDLVGCFSSPPSSWELALAAERQEADRLRQLVTRILPLEAWEQGFAMMRTGEAVKILIDMEA
jgi:L-iditol 2-dehydrogenase